MQKSIVVIGDDGILTRQAMEIAALVDYTDIQCLECLDPEAAHVFIASSDLQLRAELIASVDSDRLVNLIHPTACVSATVRPGTQD